MKARAVPSTWVRRDGLRLDGRPYLSGALEARESLERLRADKVPLHEVTNGGMAGIYHAGREGRQWVDDLAYGVPFLGSTDILLADLTGLSLLSNKQVKANPSLLIRKDWVLITRSGTIGRMAYSRADMDGMACTEDVLRVVPNSLVIPPGYLYAYLSGNYGSLLIKHGIYGAIIQHIEPEHIAYLPVPRLKAFVEQSADVLVRRAASLRVQAALSLESQVERVVSRLGFVEQPKSHRVTQIVTSSDVRRSLRLEAWFYNPEAMRVDRWARSHPNGFMPLGQICDVFDVPPFKHIYVEDGHGPAFYTSGDLFKLDRSPDLYLSKSRTKGLEKYVLGEGWILLARSGQLGGVIGRPQFSSSDLVAATASDHVIRIVPRPDGLPSGYVFAFLLSTKIGYPLLTKTMTGHSVPALWPKYLVGIPIVPTDQATMCEIDVAVRSALELRVEASKLEQEARALVDRAIEEGPR